MSERVLQLKLSEHSHNVWEIKGADTLTSFGELLAHIIRGSSPLFPRPVEEGDPSRWDIRDNSNKIIPNETVVEAWLEAQDSGFSAFAVNVRRKPDIKALFIVGGEDSWVVVNNPQLTFKAARDEVLLKTRNTGRPPEDWEIRNERGAIIDPEVPVALVMTTGNSRFFLSLRVGSGGELDMRITAADERILKYILSNLSLTETQVYHLADALDVAPRQAREVFCQLKAKFKYQPK